MLKEMQHATISEYLIPCVHFKQWDHSQHLCVSSTSRSSQSKQ
ncbi:hypothetical protein MtrunA17_Chr7g0218021 [Medicago truncatula]|uniref:Uncharacterized protein n=1 Tax=Medicago truncatula TaxID=3880 RepID=A0A396GT66_MEDTR|nr:hypothetical protein MtrunA17_Chr7g0218021 [Medicago truncatula]